MQPDKFDIGIIEDDPIMGESLVQRLELEGHKVDWWTTGSDAINSPALLDKQMVICDIRLPDITGETVFHLAGKKGIATPFLFITGFGEIDQAVRLMRRGACDYLTKPFELDELIEKIGQHAQHRTRTGDHLPSLGVSNSMKILESNLESFATKNYPILLTGEVGVGKQKAARFFHSNSSSATAPFMQFSCRLVPADMHVSELFGAKDNSDSFIDGYVSRTKNGTLYIEDIELLSMEAQVKLLTLLDTGSYTPGSLDELEIFEGRLFAASKLPISELQTSGDLNEALYYQLSILKSEIPPLRERVQDISWLLSNLLMELNDQAQTITRSISAQAEEVAIAYDWPGNIFEMRNRVQRAIVLSQSEELTVSDLFPDIAYSDQDEFPSLAQVREDAEKRQILRALNRSSGHMINAAKLLGVSRTTLWEKMGRLGITAD